MSWSKTENIRNAGVWLERKIKLIEKKEILVNEQESKHVELKRKGGTIIYPPIRKIHRGNIYYVDLGYGIGGEKTKLRPCLVLSPNRMNKGHTVLVAPLSSKFKKKPDGTPKYDNHYMLKKETYNILTENSVVKFEDARSVDVARFDDMLFSVAPEDMNKMKKNLLFICGF